MKPTPSLAFSALCFFLLALQPSMAAQMQQADSGQTAYLLNSDINFMQDAANIDQFLKRLAALNALPETETSLYWTMSSANALALALENAGRGPEAKTLRDTYADLGAALAIANKANSLAREGNPDAAVKELMKLKAMGRDHWSIILTFSALPDITYEYYKAGHGETALNLYGTFEHGPYVNLDNDVNKNRLNALDGLIRLASYQNPPDFPEVLKLYKRLELCKSEGACSDSDVAQITASLIQVMLRAGRFDDADMLYTKILALKDDPTAGEKTESTEADYSAKCRVRMFQQQTANNLIQAYDNQETAAKMRAVYDQAHAIMSADILGQGYLVDIAKTLIVKTAQNAASFNAIFQTLTLPENILLPENAYSTDGPSFFAEQSSARTLYLRMYQQLFLQALGEKDLKLAQSLYEQGGLWKADKKIAAIRADMKTRLDAYEP